MSPAERIQMRDVIFLLSSLMASEDWEMFTDEQKDLIADAIDASGERVNRAEGLIPGDDLAYQPEPRWWRTVIGQDAAA